MCKYVYKGNDAADIFLREQFQHDEITHYTNNCHGTAPEACWCLFKFPIMNQSHSLFQVALHLQHCQPVFLRNEAEINQLVCQGASQDTHLTTS